MLQWQFSGLPMPPAISYRTVPHKQLPRTLIGFNVPSFRGVESFIGRIDVEGARREGAAALAPAGRLARRHIFVRHEVVGELPPGLRRPVVSMTEGELMHVPAAPAWGLMIQNPGGTSRMEKGL